MICSIDQLCLVCEKPTKFSGPSTNSFVFVKCPLDSVSISHFHVSGTLRTIDSTFMHVEQVFIILDNIEYYFYKDMKHEAAPMHLRVTTLPQSGQVPSYIDLGKPLESFDEMMTIISQYIIFL